MKISPYQDSGFFNLILRLIPFKNQSFQSRD
jgi:hypothetical protein